MYKFQKKHHLASLSDLINSFDMFGQTPTFNILKKTKYQSKVGVFFSLITLTIIIAYTVVAFKELFDQKNPIVISSQSQIIDTPAFPLMNNNYTFAVSVTDIKTSSLKNFGTHFTLTAQQCVRTRQEDKNGKLIVNNNCTDYPLEACTMDHFTTPQQKKYFSTINLGTVQCFSKEFQEKNPPILKSAVQGMDYEYLKIVFSPCKNSTIKSDCAPMENISNYLNSGYFVVYQSDYLIQMDNPQDPFQEIITLWTTTFSMTSSKQINNQVQVQSVSTDVGQIMKYQDEQLVIPQYLQKESQELYNGDYIIQLIVRLDNKSTHYQRSYTKIQTILGSIGGLWSVLFLIIGIIVKPIQNMFLNISLANKLFYFEQSDSKNNNQDQIIESNRKTNLVKKSMDITSQIEVKNYKQIKKKPLSLSIKQYIKIILGIKNEVNSQLDYVKHKFSQKLDIAYIINKIYEIDKLKFILLDEEQQHLFNYIPKPTIPRLLFNNGENNLHNLESTKAYKYVLAEEKSHFIKIQEAFRAYTNIQLKVTKTKIDNQILSYVDQELVEIFDDLMKDQQRVSQVLQNLQYQGSPLLSVLSSPQRQMEAEDIELKIDQKGDKIQNE